MNDYEREARERYRKQQRKLEQIDQCLGWEWSLAIKEDGYHRYFSFKGPEDTKINVRFDNGRVEFWPEMHYREQYIAHHMPRDTEKPEITCNWDRAASDIAQDMRRRLIAGAIAYVREGRKEIDKFWAKKDAAWAMLDKIAAVLGGEVSGRYNQIEKEHPDRASVRRGSYGDMMTAKVTWSDYHEGMTFTVEIRDDPELGLAVCQWLNDIWPEGE